MMLKQKGLTLVEMMIAMVLGLFVMGVVITVFSTNVRSSTENIKMIRLNQELRGVMTFMSDELKRAGYSGSSTVDDFMDEFNVSASCIRYAYDEDADATPDNTERFGFRLDTDTVQWTSSGGTNQPPAATDCTNGTWGSLTDPNIAFITTLDFNITDSSNSNGATDVNALTTNTGVSIYEVTITLTGTVDLPPAGNADGNDPRRTITETVRIRNEAPKF